MTGKGDGGNPSAESDPKGPAVPEPVDCVWKACAYGDIDRLKQFLEADPNSGNIPDDQGYYPLQWAALNNQVAALTYLLQNGADPNAKDNTGQTPLHWAAVRGALPAAETLLRSGAKTETRDKRGYTVCHVAAQYGQTAVIYHLALKWNIDVGEGDNDGRTPLHWAAYKGFADTVRLLLVLNSSVTATDKEGCTPIHWAAIRGNADAVTVLLQGGSEVVLGVREETGCTPSQLAFDKGHRHLGMQLLHAARSQNDDEHSCWSNPFMSKLIKLQLAPMIWMIIITLVSIFAYKVALDDSTGRLSGMMGIWSWFAVTLSCIGLVYLYKTTSTDPGMIPVGCATDSRRVNGERVDEDRHCAYQNLDSPVLWSGNWNQLCVTCKIVRPLRAKHCAVTDRCIEVFDHYCPWVGNAIGKGNRHYFITFLWLELSAMVISGTIASIRLHDHMRDKQSRHDQTMGWTIAFLVMDVFIGISVAALAITQATQAVRNLTTNEMANWYRYKYLHGSDGRFRNPFDRGAIQNCREICLPQLAPRAPVSLEMDRIMWRRDKSKDRSRSEDLRKDIPIVEHTWTLDHLLSHYEISANCGLTSAQVLQSRLTHGLNQLTPPESIPAWMKFLKQFQNFFAILLIVGGLFCFAAYGLNSDDDTNLYLGVVLMLVVFVTATFSYLQEAKSEKIMEGFKNMIPKKCRVIRDGSTQIIDAVDLVPGDVVEIGDGDQVPADLRVIDANDLKVDNSSLTGESEPQARVSDAEKAVDDYGNPRTIPPIEASNLIFYTTIVSSGSGKGVVVGTGDKTVMGQIAGLATETSAEASPISKEIKKFIQLISVIAISLGISFFVIGLVLGTDIVSNVVFTIGIIVANVPEGLIATVTVSLALTAKRMHSKNVLVKNLEAVETLGSTTVIASDKTGTLTQNRMTVQHCWYDGHIYRCPAARNVPQLEAALEESSGGKETVYCKNDPTFKDLQMVASLCNSSKFVLRDKHDEDKEAIVLKEAAMLSDFDLLGLDCTSDASEAALAKCFELLRHLEDFRAANPILFEIKFNSTNKWALTIHKPEDSDGNAHPVLLLKGAPERVLKMCSKIMVEGKEVPLDADWEAKYSAAYETLGGMGERVLGFAMKKMKEHKMDYPFSAKPHPNFDMTDLTFVGLISLIDPPREGVPEAVAKCKRARIKVFMVTGDHPITAEAIAKQVGIIDQDKMDDGKAAVVKGDDIRAWTDMTDPVAQKAAWDKALSHEQIVWARVSPAHKLLIVENAQQRGEVVAVTGDGVNDAPALKKGDIGVAMGIAGKDVSKEAADMILMDDNFASIVNGVEEGRLIFDNLKKSIAYTLTSNIPEIAPFLLYITINLPLPLSTVLILCVDLGTDMVPAISLAYEQKESDIMDRPPRNAATDRLVNRRLISFAYLQIGVMQALAGFFTYMILLNDFGYTPGMLMGHGLHWKERSIMCTVNENLRPNECGYGCGVPEKSFDSAATLYGLRHKEGLEFCEEGCQVPFPGTSDPFSEFTEFGFRGFGAGEAAVCGRTCAWYEGLTQEEIEVYRSARHDSTNPLRYILTEEDEVLFEVLCDQATFNDKDKYGFLGREAFEGKDKAPVGSYYWWDGERQLWPNKDFQQNALQYAQTAYFVSIVVVQWADLLIAKTRKLSLFTQGLKNGFMNFGLVFETCLAILLVYTPPLNTIFGTRPIHFVHWFTGVPWSLLIFIYDEIRKFLMRKEPAGWLDRFTYW